LYRSINVTDYRHAPSTISALNIIAAHLENNTPISEEEVLFLTEIRPLKPGEEDWPYNCYANNNLFFSDWRLHMNFILSHEAEVWQLAERLTARAPQPTLHYLWCNSAYVFQMQRPPDSYYEFGVNFIIPNEFGLQMKSFVPQLQKRINDLMVQDAWLWLLGRVAFWLYLSIFTVVIFAVRYRSPLYLIVLTPSLLVTIPMAFLGGWPAFRYVYPSYLVGILLFGFMFIEQLIAPKEEMEVNSSNKNDLNKGRSNPK
jgi:hypothetical protein